MLKLLAIAAEDGWAFVRDNGYLVLVKPPFKKEGMLKVTAETLATAVVRHGFTTLEKEFDGWRSLIDFLKDEVIRSRKEMGQKLDIEKIRDLISFAPPEVLQKYLGRIETELFPRGQYQTAEVILERLLQVQRVRENPALSEKAEALLKDCRMKEALKNRARADLTYSEEEFKRNYSSLAKKYNPVVVRDRARKVQTDGLLSMGH